MLTGLLAGLLGGAGGWLAGRVHLRTNQLKALNHAVGLPEGTLEDKANIFTEAGAGTVVHIAAAHAADIIAKTPAVKGK